MLSVDTNVVVRYLVTDDDPRQSERARTLIDGQPVFVPLTVILETEWVLRSNYRLSRESISEAFRAFAGLANVKLEAEAAVARAIAWSGAGIDFADALHVAATHDTEAFVTFDRRLVKRSKTLAGTNVRLL